MELRRTAGLSNVQSVALARQAASASPRTQMRRFGLGAWTRGVRQDTPLSVPPPGGTGHVVVEGQATESSRRRRISRMAGKEVSSLMS